MLADRLGWPSLGSGAGDEAAGSRKSGVGSLLGYATGVGVGIAYGLIRGRSGGSSPLAGVLLGLAAMAASDVPIAASGVSDPRTWGVSGWAADAIPHPIYGLATVAAYGSIDA